MKKKILSILTVLAVGILVLSGFGVAAVTSSKATMDNHPPDAPFIDGEKGVIIGVEFDYYFNATDPDGDNVSYLINWDDGTGEEWTDFYPSGEEITRSHTYNLYGTFVITAIAKDIHGLVGPEGCYIPEWKWRNNKQSAQKLVVSAGAAVDCFGGSVSMDGDYAIVGADLDDDNGFHSGSAYIFIRSGTTWTKQAKLLASDGAAVDYFGVSVSIDGDYAIIGAYWEDGNGYRSGSAYVFKRDGTTWNEQAKLLASDGATYDCFGCSVSIDGDYAIIGAEGDDSNRGSGSAYVFKRDGTAWTEQAKLLASDGAAVDYFGCSVSIDGDYAIIGAYWDDDNRGRSGSAYIFTRSGTTWTQQTKLVASDGAEGDNFGVSVSIDGDYAIIGAWHDDDYRGAAYIFKRTGTSWAEEDKLTASDGTEEDCFGVSVSIDGDYAIIGAYWDRDNGYFSGSAYVFKRDGTAWTEQAKLLASDGTDDDRFGNSVSINGDYAIIGAPWDEDNVFDSGSAYIFKRDGTTWYEQDKLILSNRAYSNTLLLRLLERFPFLERFLNLLIK